MRQVVLFGVVLTVSGFQETVAPRVLDSKDGSAPRLLESHLLRELERHFASRRRAVAAVRGRESFIARRNEIDAALRRICGPLPERTPLRARVVGRMQRDGYRIENVIYESRPRHHVTANLYVPDGIPKPVPGVLVPCGHSQNGKAAPAYQHMAISLAQHGMVALVYDPIGQGERHQLLDAGGKPLVRGTTEHTLLGIGALLVGLTAANYRIHDGIRSLDYLASRPEVDGARLGCTGNSGGGTMTAYLMAFDERILAAAPSCYLTSLERLFHTIGPQDAEQNFPGQVASGLEHADFLWLRAPKPTLICAATRDFFDIDGTWTTFREAKRIYGLLGHGERAGIFEFDDKHGFSQPRRQAVLRWMRRWLLGADDAAGERPHVLASDAQLACTKSGEVLVDCANGRSVRDLNVERARALAAQRRGIWQRARGGLAEVRRLAAIRDAADVAVHERGNVRLHGRAGRKLLLSRKNEIPIPGLLFPAQPPSSSPRPVLLWASDRGKASLPKGALRATDRHVLAFDVRGTGETRAGGARRFGGYFGTDFKTAFLAMHLGRPLLGQRAEEVLAVVRWLRTRGWADSKRIELVGAGTCGPVVLHAAALDEGIAKVTVRRSIRAWTEVVGEPLLRDQLGSVVPSALESYDLPDLVRAIAPRQVVIED